ncbi:MAG: hypothetical protein HXS46_06180 [Theionarchaea archaeon]|nr:hypothetical protein [Theionarchaea archaeon]
MDEQERKSRESKSLPRLRDFCKKRSIKCTLLFAFCGSVLGYLLGKLLHRMLDDQAFGIFLLSVIGLICIYLMIVTAKKKKPEYVVLLALLVVVLTIGIHYVRQGPREKPVPETLVVWDHIFEYGAYTMTLRNYTNTDILIQEEFRNGTLVGVLNVVVKANSCERFTLQGTYVKGDTITLMTDSETVVEITI